MGQIGLDIEVGELRKQYNEGLRIVAEQAGRIAALEAAVQALHGRLLATAQIRIEEVGAPFRQMQETLAGQVDRIAALEAAVQALQDRLRAGAVHFETYGKCE